MRSFAKKQFRKKNFEKGFTLIEITVVMFLAVMTIAVVVPRFYGTLDNFKADAEEQAFLELMERVAYRAFFQSRKITLVFTENRICYPDKSEVGVFKFLHFPQQAVDWNSRGFTRVTGIDYSINGRNKHMSNPFALPEKDS